ncbi:MAG: STAS domain-containing protein [Gammaproteobacteria bacterium]|nr:STAS domain-containing protein [Gammaproteobacteria bacterium]
MDIESQRFADTVVLSARGRVDHETSEQLKNALLIQVDSCEADGERLVIDLSEVEYISSVGLRALMMAAKRVQAQDAVMVVAKPTSVVREILEISRFHLMIRMFDDVPAALAALSPQAAEAYGAR